MTPEDILAEARSWIGTPYRQQQCVKGMGVDCAQLILGVFSALGYFPMPGPEMRQYGLLPEPGRLRLELARKFQEVPKDGAQPGDVLLMWCVRGTPQHLGILSGYNGRGIIHATNSAGINRVVETSLPVSMWRCVNSVWRAV